MNRLRLVCAVLCLVSAAAAPAQTTAAPSAGIQQLQPFATPVPPAMPAAPAAKPAPAPVPTPLPAAGGGAPLPQGLRAILIRDNGQGLLGGVDANALSIAVANGKPVRIGGHDYHAEVSATVIRLYAGLHAGLKGRLVWEGSLGSAAPVSAPLDLSQLKFVPPLSAGVSPGLKAGQAKGAAAADAPSATPVSP